MMLAETVRRLAAAFGIHASRLAKHPATTVLGLRNRPIDLIVDVGANTGQFAQEMRRHFPAAHIISVEPLPEAYAQLSRWTQNDGNASAINCALGEAEAVLPINLHVDHPASSSLLATRPEGLAAYPRMEQQTLVEVPVHRLDDVLLGTGRAVGLNTLVKLDVQGFEEQVMRGAPLTLARAGALLTEVSIDPLYAGQAEFFALCRLAEAAGLRYVGNYSQHLADDGHVIFLDALFLRRAEAPR